MPKNEEPQADYDFMKENLKLKRQLAELQKENDFLKKSGGILCEGNRLEAYRFIQKFNNKFGLRWLIRKFNICSNAYYNYLKNRKADYYRRKNEIKNSIREIYHSHGGVDGYRTVHAYLIRKGYDISCLTVHKYMNTEMQLFSISRKKKPAYEHGIAHRVYENKLNQDFHANAINQKWCTDFTYLFLTDGSKRYNCTIIDLHDRSVIASITDKSMSKAGYPYDNAPMERYFNTLKNDLIYQHYYRTEDELYTAVEEFAYVQYNHVRPHSYNNYKTPYEARHGVT